MLPVGESNSNMYAAAEATSADTWYTSMRSDTTANTDFVVAREILAAVTAVALRRFGRDAATNADTAPAMNSGILALGLLTSPSEVTRPPTGTGGQLAEAMETLLGGIDLSSVLQSTGIAASTLEPPEVETGDEVAIAPAEVARLSLYEETLEEVTKRWKTRSDGTDEQVPKLPFALFMKLVGHACTAHGCAPAAISHVLGDTLLQGEPDFASAAHVARYAQTVADAADPDTRDEILSAVRGTIRAFVRASAARVASAARGFGQLVTAVDFGSRLLLGMAADEISGAQLREVLDVSPNDDDLVANLRSTLLRTENEGPPQEQEALNLLRRMVVSESVVPMRDALLIQIANAASVDPSAADAGAVIAALSAKLTELDQAASACGSTPFTIASRRDKFSMKIWSAQQRAQLQAAFVKGERKEHDTVAATVRSVLWSIAPHNAASLTLIAMFTAYSEAVGSSAPVVEAAAAWSSTALLPLHHSSKAFADDWLALSDPLRQTLLAQCEHAQERERLPANLDGEVATILHHFVGPRPNRSDVVARSTWEGRSRFIGVLLAILVSPQDAQVTRRWVATTALGKCFGTTANCDSMLLQLISERRHALSSVQWKLVSDVIAPVFRVFGCDERVLDDEARLPSLILGRETGAPFLFTAAQFPMMPFYRDGEVEFGQTAEGTKTAHERLQEYLRGAEKTLHRIFGFSDATQRERVVKAIVATGEFVSQYTQRSSDEVMAAGREAFDAARQIFFGSLNVLREMRAFAEKYPAEQQDVSTDAIDVLMKSIRTRFDNRTAVGQIVAHVRLALYVEPKLAPPAPVAGESGPGEDAPKEATLSGPIAAASLKFECDEWVRLMWTNNVTERFVFSDSGINTFDNLKRAIAHAAPLEKEQLHFALPAVRSVLEAQSATDNHHDKTIIDAIASSLLKKPETRDTQPRRGRRGGGGNPSPTLAAVRMARSSLFARHIAMLALVSLSNVPFAAAVLKCCLIGAAKQPVNDAALNCNDVLAKLVDMIERTIQAGSAREAQSAASLASHVFVDVIKPALGETPQTGQAILGMTSSELFKLTVKWIDTITRACCSRIMDGIHFAQSRQGALFAVRELRAIVLAVKRSQEAVQLVVTHAKSKFEQSHPTSAAAQLTTFGLMDALVRGYAERAATQATLATLWGLTSLESLAYGMSSAPVLLPGHPAIGRLLADTSRQAFRPVTSTSIATALASGRARRGDGPTTSAQAPLQRAEGKRDRTPTRGADDTSSPRSRGHRREGDAAPNRSEVDKSAGKPPVEGSRDDDGHRNRRGYGGGRRR
jgi:hypothetical protein